MKIRFGHGMFVVLALSMVGVVARAQSNPTADTSSADATVATTQPTTAAAPDNGAKPGDSHVRIVRLSDAKGMLALDRKTGLGFEQTMQNMPIVEGQRLQTAEGYAEVEFEDNSTLRLAPNSQVDFPLLALRSTGAKASTMSVVKGTVYVTTESTKGNEILLVAGETKINVAPSTHLRLQVADGKTVLSVFNGSAEVQKGAETTVVAKKQSLTLDGDQVIVAKKVSGEPYDAWDKESNEYHQRYSAANTFAGGGNSFGLSDLNYYGSFINAGGASFWQPYFAGAGWSPYANGVWAMYPGAGYSWVSPYPWGWLPYHSGNWSFFPGYGWGWQPGGGFNGLNNVTNGTMMTGNMPTGAGGMPVNGIDRSTMHSPTRPAMPQAPTATGATRSSLVMANDKPIVMSRPDRDGNFVFQKDSAGLGVPRGSLGNLNHVNHDVDRHGSASMPVYAGTPGGTDGNNAHNANRGPATLRPGYGDGQMGPRGNTDAASGARQGGHDGASRGGGQGGYDGSRGGGQGSPSYHGGGSGGGGGQPTGAAAPTTMGNSGSNAGAVTSGGSNHGPISAPR